MNINIIRPFAGAGILLVVLSVAGCKDNTVMPPKADASSSSAQADPRSKVLGVEPGGPTKETAATTSPAKSDISKTQEANAMPLPGQANDHSTLSTRPSQKSPTPAR